MSFRTDDFIWAKESARGLGSDRGARYSTRTTYRAPAISKSEQERIRRNQVVADNKSRFEQLYPHYREALLKPYKVSTPQTPWLLWPSLRLQNECYSYPAWSSETTVENNPRIETLNKLLNTQDNSTKNVELVDLLLGPRVAMAIGKAAQQFLNPERQFFQQCYVTVQSFIQYELEGLSDEQKNSALQACFKTYPVLQVLLKKLTDQYVAAFPQLQPVIDAFMQTLFHERTFKNSLFFVLNDIDEHMKKNGHMPHLMTLDALEAQALHDEKARYRVALTKHLQDNPDDKEYFRQVLTDVTLDDNGIIEAMLSSPAMLPQTVSHHFLSTLTEKNLAMAIPFMHHGAEIAHLSDVDFKAQRPLYWQIMTAAVETFRPKNPKDAMLCDTLSRSYLSKGTHAKERWVALALSMRRFHEEEVPFSQALHDTCERQERWWPSKSRLHGISKHFQSIDPFLPLSPIVHLDSLELQKNHETTYSNTVVLPELTTDWVPFFDAFIGDDRCLKVQGNWFEQGDNVIIAMMSGLSVHFNKINRLSFRQTLMNDAALDSLIRQRGWVSSVVGHIKELDLSANPITDAGIRKLSNYIARWRSLETLHIGGTFITEQGLKELIAALHDTNICYIYHTLTLSTATKERLEAQLAANREKRGTFEPLSIDRDRADYAPVFRGIEEECNNDLIDTLFEHIQETENRDREIFNIMRSLTGINDIETVEHLDLSERQLGDKQLNIRDLLEYLSIRADNLKSFSIEGQSLTTLSNESFSNLMQVLSRFPQLEHINFNNTRLAELPLEIQSASDGDFEEYKGEPPTVTTESRMAIMARDLNCASLKIIHMERNRFEKKDLKFLEKIVKQHNALEILQISFGKSEWLATWHEKLVDQLTQSIENLDNQPIPNTQNQTVQTEILVASPQMPVHHEESDSTSGTLEIQDPNSLIQYPLSASQQRLLYERQLCLDASRCIMESAVAQRNQDGTWLYPVRSQQSCLTFLISASSLRYMDSWRNKYAHHHNVTQYRNTFERYFENLLVSGEVATIRDMTVNPGLLRKIADVLVYPLCLLSSGANQFLQCLVRVQDEYERKSYFDTVAKVGHIIGRGEQRTRFIQWLSGLIIEQYCYYLKTEELTESRAIKDAFAVRDWMAYCHFDSDPLFEVKQIEKSNETATLVHCRRPSILFELLHGESDVIVPVPVQGLTEYHNILSTPHIKPLIDNIAHETWEPPKSIITSAYDLPFLVTPREQYEDESVTDVDLKKLELFLRDIFLSATQYYKEKHFYGQGYYERFFMPLLKRHGGRVSIADCQLLIGMVKEKSWPDFLSELRAFIQEHHRDSGESADSLFSLFLNDLLLPLRQKEQKMAKHNNVLPFFPAQRREEVVEADKLLAQIVDLTESKTVRLV